MHRMAQLMQDDVVGQFGRQGDQAPVEVEVLLRAATPPRRPMVLDAHLPVDERVDVLPEG